LTYATFTLGLAMILTPAVDRLDAADLLPGLRVSRNHDICDLDPPDLLVPVEEYVFVVLYQQPVGVDLLGPDGRVGLS